MNFATSSSHAGGRRGDHLTASTRRETVPPRRVWKVIATGHSCG